MNATPPRTARIVLALLAALLVAATVAVYWEVPSHEFINLDDNQYLTSNERMRGGLSWDNVEWALTTFYAANWHPLTWLSYLVEISIFGLSSPALHITNIALHCAGIVLLFLVLRLMTGAVWRSFFVAGVFALHPLHVESVAWTAERKDVLSTVFWMTTMLAYWWYARSPNVRRYLVVVLSFAVGLTAKPMLVTLPLLLLMLDWWPLNRMSPERGRLLRLLLEKIPMLALSAASSVVTYIAQREGGAIETILGVPFGTRLQNALISYVLYLGKAIYPVRLAVYYPYQIPVTRDAIIAGGVLAVLSALVLYVGRKQKAVFVGWFWYVGTMVPVIGAVQVGRQGMADRYMHVPIIGLAIVLAWGLPRLLARWRWRTYALGLAGAAVFAGMALQTVVQVRYWRNSETLYRRTLAVTEKNWLIHNNLSVVYSNQGKLDEAIYHVREGLKYNIDLVMFVNLGNLLARRGLNEQAIAEYKKALVGNPYFTEARYAMANTLVKMKKYDEAIDNYRMVLEQTPLRDDVQTNVGFTLYAMGRFDEAARHLREAIRLNPSNPEAHNNLGVILLKDGKVEEAEKCFRSAMMSRANYATAMANLADVLNRKGNRVEALRLLREALRIEPGNMRAKSQLATIEYGYGTGR